MRSKKLFRMRDTYSVEVAPDEGDVVILLDDAGFGDSSAFDSPVNTPTAAGLVGKGLK
jgi:hypothetical protein